MMKPSGILWTSYFKESSIGAWESPEFGAAAFRDGEAIRLDVFRKDMKDGITWDQLQEIKKECGYGDRDAVEFFPAEKDTINTGNYRHLYIFEEKLPLVRRGHP
jgi:hypothetical protein